MSFLREQNRTGLVLALLLLIGMGLLLIQQYGVWQHVIIVTPEDAQKDYVGKVWQAFMTDPISLMFGETEGSAPFLKFFSIGLIWIWASYALGRIYSQRKHVIDKLYWGSLAWCVYATAWVMIAWIWGAGVQHFGWYACYPQTIGGVVHQCYLGEQGTLDTTTNWFTPGALFGIIATVNLKDTLGLRGRTGRGLELGIYLGIMALVIIGFEVVESGNPAVYANVLWNSVTDVATGLAAVGFNAGWYNTIVSYEE